MLYLSKLGRFYSFGSLHVSDSILFGLSVYVMQFYYQNLAVGMVGNPEEDARTLALNFAENKDYPFSFVFSILVGMLVLRLTTTLLFNESIGPLIKILGKMTGSFTQFFFLYILMAGLFSLIFFTAFSETSTEYNSMYKSFIFVFDLTIGNFDLFAFNKFSSPISSYMGQGLVILAIIIFNLVLINLLVSVLANIYEMYDAKGDGLYLMMLLRMRDEQSYDEDYGAFLAAMPPLSFVQLPFIPLSMIFPKESETLRSINMFVGQMQYFMFMVLPFSLFMMVSLVLIPFAYLVGIGDKIFAIKTSKLFNKNHLYVNLLVFVVLGPIILLFDIMIGDVYYFWMNSFRRELKKCVIKKEVASVSHRSLK